MKNLLFAIIALFFAGNLYAQSEIDGLKNADGFFDKGFVSGSEQKKEEQKSKEEEEESDSHNKPIVHEKINPIDGVSGKKILALGAILAGDNLEDLKKNLDYLAQVAIDKDLSITIVFSVNMEPIISPKDPSLLKIWALGGGLQEVYEIPTEYKDKISQSPTWIVYTEEGQILLEGVPNLYKYINVRGEFVDTSIPVLRSEEGQVQQMLLLNKTIAEGKPKEKSFDEKIEEAKGLVGLKKAKEAINKMK